MRTGRDDALLTALITTVVAAVNARLSFANAAEASCEDLQTDFRYPCVCEELGQIGGLALNCDGVVYPGDHVNLPKGVPVLVFTQRNAGHHTVPAQLFPSTGM